MKIKDKYLWSNIAIVVGLLSMLGVTDILLIKIGMYGSWETGSHFSVAYPGLKYGLMIIVGALIYKATKKRKFCSSKAWLSVEVIGLALFIFQFMPFKTGGYLAPTYEYVEQINWPFADVWFFATESNVVPEYKVPAIITLIVWVWTIAAYSFIKSRKNRQS